MPLHTIKAPVPFTGVGPGGLRFTAGRAQSDDEVIVGWFRDAGYVIDGLPRVVEAVGSLAPAWTPDSLYDVGELVWHEGLLQRRKVAGIDGSTFDPAQWEAPGTGTFLTSEDARATYVSYGPDDPAIDMPPGQEYVWHQTDGAGTLLDIVSGVAS